MRTTFTASRPLGAASKPDPKSGSSRLIIRVLHIKTTAIADVEAVLDHMETELEQLVTELEGRVLDDMMLGAVTTLHGLASWVFERLAMAVPKLTRVEICEDDRCAAVERTA